MLIIHTFNEELKTCFSMQDTFERSDIQEGKDTFISAHGMRIFEYIGLNEQFACMFNHAMSESSTMIMKKILEVYRGFEDINTFGGYWRRTWHHTKSCYFQVSSN